MNGTLKSWDGTQWVYAGGDMSCFGAYKLATANYAPVASDWTIEYKTGPFTVTLGAAATFTKKVFNITNSSTSNITVTPNGAETIAGETSQIVYPGSSMHIQSNDTGWIII